MKRLTGILRILAMTAAAGLLLAAGESDSSASQSTTQLAIPSAQTSGVALVLGAYPKEENGKLDGSAWMKHFQGHGSIDGHDYDSPCG